MNDDVCNTVLVLEDFATINVASDGLCNVGGTFKTHSYVIHDFHTIPLTELKLIYVQGTPCTVDPVTVEAKKKVIFNSRRSTDNGYDYAISLTSHSCLTPD